MNFSLAQVATAFRDLSGLSNTSNAGEVGYWREIALSAEELAGAATTANQNRAGWMLRAAVALEEIEGTDGDAENRNYSGLLKRIVDAMEEGNGAVGTGSLMNRLLAAAGDYAGGTARVKFTPVAPFSLAENAANGSAVTTASVVNGTGTYTYTLTVNVGSKLAIDTNTGAITKAAALDYDTTTSHAFTVEADNGVDPPITKAGTLLVTNILEVTLNAITGTFELAEDAAAAAVAGAMSGKSSGSTLSLTDDAGGRVAISGTNIVRGATALDYESATSHSFTVRETHADGANSPRDTVLTLTVTDVVDTVPTPVLTWTSDNTVLDPEFHTTEIEEDDVVEIQIDNNSDFSSLFDSDTNTIDAGEAASGELTFATDTLSVGTTYYARIRYTRGVIVSDWSNTVSKSMVSGGEPWLLDGGTWSDAGVWDDASTWEDA